MRLLKDLLYRNRFNNYLQIKLFSDNSGLAIFNKNQDYRIVLKSNDYESLSFKNIESIDPCGGPILSTTKQINKHYSIKQFNYINESKTKVYVRFEYTS